MEYHLFHAFNRGVEKRCIFLDKQDYLRFITTLFLCNNRSGRMRTRIKDVPTLIKELYGAQKPLVEILRVTLMPNHYHLILAEKEQGMASEFMRRIGNSYTKYFNTRYKGRSGYLFQNKAGLIPIVDESHYLYLPTYVDLNCLELKFPHWKERCPNRHADKRLSYIKQFPWSSIGDPLGVFEFVNHSLLYSLLDTTPGKYEKDLLAFLKEPSGLEQFGGVSTWQV